MGATVRRAQQLCFMLCSLPALWLAGEWACGALGPNPLDRLLHFSGRSALLLLLLTLSVSPLRKLSVRLARTVHARLGKRMADWNWLIRLRRQLGLFTFAYALLHVAIYVALDVGPNWAAVWEDGLERRFVAVGWVGLVLLLPLAATSTHAAMRALGVWWRRLHLLAYAAAALGLAHFGWQAKTGAEWPWPETLLLALLLGSRLHAWWRGERAPAAEVQRPPAAQGASGTGPGAAPRARPRPASSR